MTTAEGKVKRRVSDVLKAFGPGVYYYMPVQNGMGMPSLDYVGSAYGYFFAIETKELLKLPTDRQTQTMARMRAAGAKVFVIDDDYTLGQLKAWLELVKMAHGGNSDFTGARSGSGPFQGRSP